MNQNAKTALIAVAAAVLTGLVVFGATVWYYNDKDGEDDGVVQQNVVTNSSNTTTTGSSGSVSTYNTKDYDYDLLNLESFPVQQSLVRKAVASGKQETILTNADLEKALSDLADVSRPKVLVEVSEPTESRYVYYTIVLDGTEDSGNTLYQFDTTTEKFTKMNVSADIVKNTGGLTSTLTRSTDGERLALTSDLDGKSQDLYVVNLAKDTMTKVISLTGNETMNGGDSGLSSYVKLSWKDATTLSYEVFDKTTTETHSNTSQIHKMIETRTVEVK